MRGVEVKVKEIVNLTINDKAPGFEAIANGNRKIKLEDFSGNYLVLYFYPKDDTTACTLEAIKFSEYRDKFSSLNAFVLGVSKDGISSHEKFIAKHDINFNLLVDKDAEIAKSYGIWIEKSMFGKKYMGMDRSTFLIDPSGYIKHIWRDVKVEGHAEEVIKTIEQLSSK